MNKDNIAEKIEIARLDFLSLHDPLLKLNANERSMTHKFAECLVPLFYEERWDIDCEYNRDEYEPKRIGLIPIAIQNDNTDGESVFPDIIVHHREKKGVDNNLLIIEAKKDAPTGSSKRESDIDKIRNIMNDLHYQFGIFINFKTGSNSDIDFEFIE